MYFSQRLASKITNFFEILEIPRFFGENSLGGILSDPIAPKIFAFCLLVTIVYMDFIGPVVAWIRLLPNLVLNH